MNIAVFVSGSGTNLQALIDAQEQGKLSSGKITLVVCDKAEAFALKRAEKAGVETYLLEASGYASREEYDKKITDKLKEENVDLVVLAGFMRILSDPFIEAHTGKILNVHPAILPSFKGTHGIKDAFEYGVKVTGVTVHFVEKELDAGPVISQEEVRVEEDDTLDSLVAKIHAVEHKLYPEAVRLFVEGNLKIDGRKVIIS